MLRKSFLFLAICSLLFGACHIEQPSQTSTIGKSKSSMLYVSHPHFRLARKVVADVHPFLNEYGSNPTILRVGMNIGGNDFITAVRAKCATFVTSLLNYSYGNNMNISNWLGCTSPLAKTYHDAIIAGNGFNRKTNIADVRPGHVIAMSYIEHMNCQNVTCGSTNGCNGGLSGHMGFANNFPQQLQNETINNVTYGVYSIDILDSTQFKHHTQDTRHNAKGNGVDGTGAGIGTMRLYTNPNTGEILGYRWSMSNGPFYLNSDNTTLARHIVVGSFEYFNN